LTARRVIAAGFFLLGLALFGYLLFNFGIDTVIRNVSESGSCIAGVVALWLVIYLLNTLSWKLALGPAGAGIPFGTLFLITVSGFAINTITPVVALGGEPYRVQALSPSLGAHRAISAVVLYRMVNLLGHMFMLLAGVVTAFFVVDPGPTLAVSLGAAGAAVAAVIVLTISGTRHGVFDRLAGFARRFRMLSAIPFDRYSRELGAMDGVLTDVYRNDRRRFTTSVFLEVLTRLLMGIEVWIVLRALGVGATPAEGVFVYVAFSIAINLLFFVPMGAGTQEGGILLGLQSLSIDPALAVSVGVILRIREFIWIGAGLIFVLFTRREKGAVGPAGSQTG